MNVKNVIVMLASAVSSFPVLADGRDARRDGGPRSPSDSVHASVPVASLGILVALLSQTGHGIIIGNI